MFSWYLSEGHFLQNITRTFPEWNLIFLEATAVGGKRRRRNKLKKKMEKNQITRITGCDFVRES